MSTNTDSTILQIYARTPAPCRDYCGLTVTKEEITLNIWNVTHGPHVYPKRFKCALHDLPNNKFMKMEIGRVFGLHVLEYTDCLSKNEIKLENFPTKVFLKILRYLAAKDVLNLSQTSKIMFERCNDDDTWSILFRKFLKTSPNDLDIRQIEKYGWRYVIRDKLGLKRLLNNQLKVENIATVQIKSKSDVMKSGEAANKTGQKPTKETSSKSLTKVKSGKRLNTIEKRAEPRKATGKSKISENKLNNLALQTNKISKNMSMYSLDSDTSLL